MLEVRIHCPLDIRRPELDLQLWHFLKSKLGEINEPILLHTGSLYNPQDFTKIRNPFGLSMGVHWVSSLI